ncbi:Carbon monoxide dehydrogenase subunit G [Haloechinothrix alba]|uniref:Carbon monoxide dehydrogenase subunit G n=1 Tax=Haloechinothrix alba TaxID=664784 RepID=A0A239AES9_9PSEU|nr:SRPBCC family protein [Haloechinothrix alba]SNR94070.1 Carbon monoxide dehydrogenase subunit G [Haloechinothrix alba]
MRLDHEFTVPAPVEEVWQALLDPERVAPCMPGATLTGVDGDEFTATMKVKLGPISLQYKGTGEFTDKDEAARRLVIKASGKDTRGGGTASADVAVTLTEDGGVTSGSVATDLTVTGRPAQFGRGMISEVGGRLLGDFSTCLGERLGTAQEPATDQTSAGAGSAAGSGAPAASGGDPKGEHEAAPINLMDVAGAPVLKRAVPIVVGAVVIIAIILAVRACR